jgi:hypothetical protein
VANWQLPVPRSILCAVILACSIPIRGMASEEGYEGRLVEWGLSLQGRELDPNPEGKVIDEILVSSEDIVARSDPYPKILNILHVKTRQDVIKREILLQPGDRYDPELAAESERNLRQLFIFAVARVLPVKSPIPGHVSILVVTKDLWSIRLNSEFNTVGSLLQLLHLRPTEQNFLGRNQQVSLDFLMRLDTISLGQAFTDRRLFGTRLSFSENAAIILNRSTGKSEGSRGGFFFGQPLYSLATEHAFGISGSWDIETARIYRGANVWQVPFPDPSTGNPVPVPVIYNAKDLEAAASYTRSYGRQAKTNISVGLGAYTRRYTPPVDLGLTDDQRAWLTSNYLPRSEDVVYLEGALELFRADYRVLRDIATFALSEDYRLGPSVFVDLRYAEPALLSSVRFLEGKARLRYALYERDDLFIATVAIGARFQPDGSTVPGASSLVNRRVSGEVVNYSPVIGPGRFAVRGYVDTLGNDLNNTKFLLGGGNGLRGTPAESLTGTTRLLFNLEYRTKALDFHTLHLGGVVFWDAGRTWGTGTTSAFTHTIGLGLRGLLPQFDLETLRIDFGYVLRGPMPSSFLDRFSASFGQVFDYRPGFLN